jgi:hypothetical protein
MRLFWTGLCLLVLLLGSSACRSTSKTPQPESPVLRNVEQGMSPSEVRTLLGAPQHTIREDGQIRWMIYGTATQQLLIYFRHAKVAAVPQRSGHAPAPGASS